MTAKLLETNVPIDITSGRGRAAAAKFEQQVADGQPLFISPVSIFEFRFGAEGSYRREAQLAGLARFMRAVRP